MESAVEAAMMDPASDAGVAELASSLRAASSAAAEFSATLLWAELYSEARRWIVRTWLSESRILRYDDVGEADEEADLADRQDHAVRDGSRL